MQLKLENKSENTIVPNEFIRNSMGAPAGFVAAYLYGLMYSQGHETIDLGVFSAHLRMPESDIIEAYEYWQKKGFVKILNGSELCFEFGIFKKLDNVDDLYSESEFFQDLQSIFGSRQLSPADYIKLLDYNTVFLLPKKVVLMLARYCVDKKGNRVSITYLDRVAKTWAEEGINTIEEAEKRIERSKQKESGILDILEQLGITNRRPTKDETELFEKWTHQWGFTLGAIRTACSHTTSSRNPSMKYLDSILYNLKEEGKTTSRTISESKTVKENTTKDIQKILNAMGETNLKPSAEHISLYQKWTTAFGYDMDIIEKAAAQAGKRGRMPVKYIDEMLTDWFNNGIETPEQAADYIQKQHKLDGKISAVLDAAGVTKMHISDALRRRYSTWNEEWGISVNAILLAAEISSLAGQPMSYLNSLLKNWHEKGVKTVTQAQKETQKRKTSGDSVGSNKRPTENYDHLAVDLFSDEGE